MPISKRSKQISLTKTKKKERSGKEKLMDKVRTYLGKYKNIIVFKFQNMRTNLMKVVKEEWSNDSKFLMGKNKVLQIALGRDSETEVKENLHMISQVLEGEKGLLFTNRDVGQCVERLKGIEEAEYAQAGQLGQSTLVLQQGLTIPMSGSIEPYLRKLGLNTSLINTEIKLNANFTLSQAGKPLSPEQCKLLKLFEYKTAKFTITPVAALQADGSFHQFNQSL